MRPSAVAAWLALRHALANADPVVCTSDPNSWTEPDEDGDDPDTLARLADLCARCPVNRECDAFAVANRETSGVWAGVNRRPSAART